MTLRKRVRKMIVLSKDYAKTLDFISDRGSEAIIYANIDKKVAYKIFRTRALYHIDEDSLKLYTSIEHKDCVKPLECLVIEGHEDEVVGHSMEFIDAPSLPFLRNARIDELLKAALEISKVVEDISRNGFAIRDFNTQNYAFCDGAYKFLDVSYYYHFRHSIKKILYKWNISMANSALLSGLIGFSYKKLISMYLDVVSTDLRRDYFKLKLTDDDFVFEVLSILEAASKENSLDEIKLKLLTPIK